MQGGQASRKLHTKKIERKRIKDKGGRCREAAGDGKRGKRQEAIGKQALSWASMVFCRLDKDRRDASDRATRGRRLET